MTATAVDYTTAAAVEEKAKLQKHFGRFDMLFFLLCTLVGLDTLGAVASNGAQGFTWLIFLAIFFFVPYALLTAELGSTFTEEGGSYIWVKLAFGRFRRPIQSVLYWLSNPIWLGGSLTITAVTLQRLPRPTSAASASTSSRWHSSGSPWWRRSCRSRSASGSRRSARSCACSCSAGFVLTVIIYAISHGVHGVGAGDFSPTYGGVHRRRAACCSSTTSASSCPTPRATR